MDGEPEVVLADRHEDVQEDRQEESEVDGTPPPDASRTWNQPSDDQTPSEGGAGPEATIETQQSEGEPNVTPRKAASGPMIIPGNKNLAFQKLDKVCKWSIITYKSTRQVLSEKMGRGSRTVDLDLEPQLEILSDDRQRYSHVTKLAQTLAKQLTQMTLTQKSLGEAFTDLSIKTPTLHAEFGLNADTQKFLSRTGETLVEAVNSFTDNMNTLVNKTIEDTMMNVKQYETARIEYDAYRCDLEELNMGPRDANTLPKLEQAQKTFQIQRDKYLKSRDDLSVKLKLLEENKVKVLHNQLWLLHRAVFSYSSSCQRRVEENRRRVTLLDPSIASLSWLEDS